MQNIFLFAIAYMFVLFYRDAVRDTRICSSKLAICAKELNYTEFNK